MRAWWLIVVVGVLAMGCAAQVRVLKWRPDDGIVVFSVPVMGNPDEAQVRQVNSMAARKCGGASRLVEEGTDLSQTPYFSMVGNVAAAGSTTTATYYWIVKCGAAPTAAADAGP